MVVSAYCLLKSAAPNCWPQVPKWEESENDHRPLIRPQWFDFRQTLPTFDSMSGELDAPLQTSPSDLGGPAPPLTRLLVTG